MSKPGDIYREAATYLIDKRRLDRTQLDDTVERPSQEHMEESTRGYTCWCLMFAENGGVPADLRRADLVYSEAGERYRDMFGSSYAYTGWWCSSSHTETEQQERFIALHLMAEIADSEKDES